MTLTNGIPFYVTDCLPLRSFSSLTPISGGRCHGVARGPRQHDANVLAMTARRNRTFLRKQNTVRWRENRSFALPCFNGNRRPIEVPDGSIRTLIGCFFIMASQCLTPLHNLTIPGRRRAHTDVSGNFAWCVTPPTASIAAVTDYRGLSHQNVPATEHLASPPLVFIAGKTCKNGQTCRTSTNNNLMAR